MELIRRGGAGYDRLRAVFDHRVDCFPAAIARCRSIDDVRAALEFAASHDLPYAVRGGAASERATLDDGLVIDVSPLKGIAVDPDRREAVVAAGVTWAELDAAASTHGLAVTGSRVSWLGVAGVALGEGSGWLERSLGRTGDSVVAVEAAEAPQEAVATALTLRLSPIEPVMLCGFLSFPGSRAREVASVYRDLMDDAPPAVGGALAVYAGRAGLCQVTFCFLGDVEEGERRLGPLRALGPGLDAVRPNPYTAFQAMTDQHHPFGMRAERRVTSLDSLSADRLDELLEATAHPTPSALSRVVLRPGGGVLEGPAWSAECLGLWPPVASLDGANLAWLDRVEAAVGRSTLRA